MLGHAILAALNHERHVRGPRAALIGGDNDAKTAFGREDERAFILDAKLGPKNVHGEALERLKDGGLP